MMFGEIGAKTVALRVNDKYSTHWHPPLLHTGLSCVYISGGKVKRFRHNPFPWDRRRPMGRDQTSSRSIAYRWASLSLGGVSL